MESVVFYLVSVLTHVHFCLFQLQILKLKYIIFHQVVYRVYSSLLKLVHVSNAEVLDLHNAIKRNAFIQVMSVGKAMNKSRPVVASKSVKKI